MQQDQKLVSIERVVAFVLGPLVIAASGTLSAWLSTQVGVDVSAPEITGAFATGGLAAGGLAWKWLHGRQAYEAIEADLQRVAAVPGADSFIKTTVKDLEGLAQSAAAKAVAAIPQSTVNVSGGPGSSPPPVEPIPPATDPAPSSGAQVAEQADGGAATGQ